jgi:hypothetical protein
MKKRDWQLSSNILSNPKKHKKALKKSRVKSRRQIEFGEEKSFEKSSGAWDLA